MAIRKTLSDRGLVGLPPMARRYGMPDPELRGHYVRVTPNGQKSFVAVARAPSGKQIWTTIGAASVFSIDDARGEAREVIKRVRAGLPPIQAKADSFADVAAIWIRRHVEKTEPDRQPASKRTKRRRARDDEPKVPLRSRREILRMLNSHILPAWRDREFISIKRSDVTKLMDDVEDKHGARAADYVLYVFASIANWHAARVDDYSSPIIRGMRRQSTKEQARDRTLDDAEIRLIWKEAESAGAFGAIVRLLLLTAQRRTKVAEMRWSEISIAGAWTIPKEPREKENAGLL